MSHAIITTVIPTFRRPELLKRAINSVLAQSFKDLQVCVYDNASGDHTEAIVQAFMQEDERVIYYKNNENIGAIANIIQGLTAVNTPFYSLLSDDDFLLPDFYQKAIDEFHINPTAEFVCSKTMVIDLINKKIQYRNKDWSAGFYQPSNEIVSKMYVSHFVTTGVLLRKSITQLIGVFDPIGSDNLYMTIASATVPFVVLDSYGAAITLHDNSYSVIDDGIIKEKLFVQYDNFLLSMNTVISLDIPNERKVHLLMYIHKFYQQIFNTKKLNHFVKKYNEEGLDNVMLLPSSMSIRGLIGNFYSICPENIHVYITALVKLLKFIRNSLLTNAKKDWLALSEEICRFFSDNECDVSKLIPYINKTVSKD